MKLRIAFTSLLVLNIILVAFFTMRVVSLQASVDSMRQVLYDSHMDSAERRMKIVDASDKQLGVIVDQYTKLMASTRNDFQTTCQDIRTANRQSLAVMGPRIEAIDQALVKLETRGSTTRPGTGG
jgi:hypothetical protein